MSADLVSDWITNGLIAIFFIIAAVSLFGIWARDVWRRRVREVDEALTLSRAEPDECVHFMVEQGCLRVCECGHRRPRNRSRA